MMAALASAAALAAFAEDWFLLAVPVSFCHLLARCYSFAL